MLGIASIDSKRVSELGSPFINIVVKQPRVTYCLSQLEILRRLALVSHRAQDVDSVRRECLNALKGAGYVQHGAEVRPFLLSRPFHVELLDPLALLHLFRNLVEDPVCLGGRNPLRGPEDDRLYLA